MRSTRTDELIPLSSVVRLEETSGTMQLARFDRLRAIKISADLANGYTMGEAVQWFEDAVARELPAEATLDWDGQTREFTRTGQQLYFTFLLALAVVYLVLAAQFESFVHPLIIMVTVPLALLGAVFGLKLFGLTINIFSQIAVIMLIGIAAKNGVLIVEFANQLRDRGIEFIDAVGASRRDAPAARAHDEPLHGVRRVAADARDRRRRGAAPADRHRRVLRHDRGRVPHVVRGARRSTRCSRARRARRST